MGSPGRHFSLSGQVDRWTLHIEDYDEKFGPFGATFNSAASGRRPQPCAGSYKKSSAL